MTNKRYAVLLVAVIVLALFFFAEQASDGHGGVHFLDFEFDPVERYSLDRKWAWIASGTAILAVSLLLGV